MHRNTAPRWLAAILAAALAPQATAQAASNTRIDYAQVLRVQPVYEVRTVQTVDPDCLRPTGASRPPPPPVEACKPKSVAARSIVAYDVEYTYKGDTYMSRLRRDPGSRVRVRVSVTPIEDAAPSPVAGSEDG
jgi:uncharacterized protein YcfJ